MCSLCTHFTVSDYRCPHRSVSTAYHDDAILLLKLLSLRQETVRCHTGYIYMPPVNQLQLTVGANSKHIIITPHGLFTLLSTFQAGHAERPIVITGWSHCAHWLHFLARPLLQNNFTTHTLHAIIGLRQYRYMSISVWPYRYIFYGTWSTSVHEVYYGTWCILVHKKIITLHFGTLSLLSTASCF